MWSSFWIIKIKGLKFDIEEEKYDKIRELK